MHLLRGWLLSFVFLAAACAATAKDRNDVTWLCPVVTKGRIYWQDGTAIRKDIPRFPEPQLIYVGADGAAVPLNDPRLFSKAVRAELQDSDLGEKEFVRLILPFYHFACLNNRDQYIDAGYFDHRAKEGREAATAIERLKALAGLATCHFEGDQWIAVFYLIREDESQSLVERHTVRGKRKPFEISEARCEFIETEIGIEPRMK